MSNGERGEMVVLLGVLGGFLGYRYRSHVDLLESLEFIYDINEYSYYIMSYIYYTEMFV